MDTPTEETITKALDNLEIDSEPIAHAAAGILGATTETPTKDNDDNAQQAHPYMGFPQMHHHHLMNGGPLPPLPHMMAYPPPPPPPSQYMMMDSNNGSEYAGAKSASSAGTDFAMFNPYTMLPPSSGSTTSPMTADPFWTPANHGAIPPSNDVSVPKSTVGEIAYTRGGSFAGPSSSAIEEAIGGEDGVFDEHLGQPKSRRQTFHSGSGNVMFGSQQHSQSTTIANSTSSRTQSISLDGPSGAIFANTTDSTNVVDVDGKKEKNTDLAQGFQQSTFPPAYPYNGPIMHPNPLYNGHPMSGSPFQPYGYPSFQSFSPIPSGVKPSGNEKNGVSGGNSGATNAAGMGLSSEDFAGAGIIPPHIDSPANIPWMYGSHSPFPAGQASMMMPNNAGLKNGGLYGSKSYKTRGGKKFNNGDARSKNDTSRGKNDDQYNDGNFNRGYRAEQYNSMISASSKYNNATLADFVGGIYSLCKDQHGCRFLQKQLDIDGEAAASMIFFEIKDHIVELMVDSFGNYLIQKLLEISSQEQKLEIVTIAAPDIWKISFDPHGTRALQKLVECITTLKEVEIIQESLKGHIVELSKDLNGNHVVQKLLTKLRTEDSEFIFQECCQSTMEIATQRHGCCVLQRCFDNGSLEQRSQLCDKIMENINILSTDPFGNYVVQYILTKEAEYGETKYTFKIVELLKGHAVRLSMHKFGSNVVENILRTPSVSSDIVTELVNSGNENIAKLLNDSYGNYVLQTSLDVAKNSSNNNTELYNTLTATLKPLLVGPIRSTPHGRKMISIIEGGNGFPTHSNSRPGHGHRGGYHRNKNHRGNSQPR
ncbi:hypothetical protein ACO0QE_004645 [Hanseniaspora vineae]